MRRTLKQVLKQAFSLLGKDIKEVKWAIIIIIAYFVLTTKISYSTCPIVTITGFPCPACGLTRAGLSLLRLDFAAAWKFHPFIYAIVIYAVCLAYRRYMLLRQNQRVMVTIGIVIIILMTVFYIWRMIYDFPGNQPMSYYSDNLLQNFVRHIDL